MAPQQDGSSDRWTRGWSGGQFSLLRIAAAFALVVDFLTGLTHSFPQSDSGGSLPIGTLAVQGSVIVCVAALVGALAIGWFDRVAALLLAGLFVFDRFAILAGGSSAGPPASLLPGSSLRPVPSLLPAIALILIAATSAAPFGSFAARGRIDPSGGWTMPVLVPLFARILFAVSFLRWLSEPEGLWLLALLPLCLEPGWIPASSVASRTRPVRIFYDGGCGLCHLAVRFVLAEARHLDDFVFSPIGSSSFSAAVSSNDRRNDDSPASMPDSIVVQSGGSLVFRSDAILLILGRLGGLWRVIGIVCSVIPRLLRDRVYDWVARNRKRLFTPPQAACPVLPAHLRERFEE